eukprot:GFYU01006191.1.p1 GENE.GFYU01006191.1~~GFYU01006191.1.p1  ORF type:complete len:530 (+),score=88.85 GFYU01006191.1:54-1592(+)
MCFMFTEEEPSKTLLVLAPVEPQTVKTGGVQEWQLAYINTVNAAHTLMVVPVPNQYGMQEQDFILGPVKKDAATNLRRAAKEVFGSYAPEASNASQSFGAAFGSAASPSGQPLLMVQSVGAYDISVAPTMDDLVGRAPWTQLNVPPTRYGPILQDMQQQYSDGFAFIIAKSVTGAISESGFTVNFRHPQAFFPTAHEVQPKGLANMDVTCIGINVIIEQLSMWGEAQAKCPTEIGDSQVVYRGDDSSCFEIHSKWGGIRRIMAALPQQCSAMGKRRMVRTKHPYIACQWTLSGMHQNTNIWGRLATREDGENVTKLYRDIDEWWLYRNQGNGQFNSGGLFNSGPFPLRIVDFCIMLLGRRWGMPGAVDRVSDRAGIALQDKIFYNLDFATASGSPFNAIDLDETQYRMKNNRRSNGHVLYGVNVDPRRLGHLQQHIQPLPAGAVSMENTTFVCISSRLEPYESVTDRTCLPLEMPATTTPSQPMASPGLFTPPPGLFGAPPIGGPFSTGYKS